MTQTDTKIGIFGGGSWGTAISIHLAKKGYPVTVWDVKSEEAALIEKVRFNGTFLPGIKLPDLVHFTPDIRELAEVNLQVMAIPTQYIRSFLELNRSFISEETPIITLSKGIENETLLRVSEIIQSFFPAKPVLVLTGPTHAEEVARNVPSAILASSKDKKLIEKTIEIFRSATFRIYPSTDVIGAEVGGALKNIIAIGTGISDGLKLGDNTRAALMTRGLEEIRRIGVALGAQSETFMGLSGMGDLIVTCSSNHSRNRRVGLALAEGKNLNEILDEMQMVAEGVRSVISAKALCEKFQIEAPIISAIYDVLYNNVKAKDALKTLMTRDVKPERWD